MPNDVCTSQGRHQSPLQYERSLSLPTRNPSQQSSLTDAAALTRCQHPRDYERALVRSLTANVLQLQRSQSSDGSSRQHDSPGSGHCLREGVPSPLQTWESTHGQTVNGRRIIRRNSAALLDQEKKAQSWRPKARKGTPTKSGVPVFPSIRSSVAARSSQQKSPDPKAGYPFPPRRRSDPFETGQPVSHFAGMSPPASSPADSSLPNGILHEKKPHQPAPRTPPVVVKRVLHPPIRRETLEGLAESPFADVSPTDDRTPTSTPLNAPQGKPRSPKHPPARAPQVSKAIAASQALNRTLPQRVTPTTSPITVAGNRLGKTHPSSPPTYSLDRTLAQQPSAEPNPLGSPAPSPVSARTAQLRSRSQPLDVNGDKPSYTNAKASANYTPTQSPKVAPLQPPSRSPHILSPASNTADDPTLPTLKPSNIRSPKEAPAISPTTRSRSQPLDVNVNGPPAAENPVARNPQASERSGPCDVKRSQTDRLAPPTGHDGHQAFNQTQPQPSVFRRAASTSTHVRTAQLAQLEKPSTPQFAFLARVPGGVVSPVSPRTCSTFGHRTTRDLGTEPVPTRRNTALDTILIQLWSWFLTFCVGAIALVIVTAIKEDDLLRNDAFHPRESAHNSRHFDYVQPFLTLKEWSIHGTQLSCIDIARMRSKGDYLPNTAPWSEESTECTFHVPLTATAAALAAGCFALFVATVRIRWVLRHLGREQTGYQKEAARLRYAEAKAFASAHLRLCAVPWLAATVGVYALVDIKRNGAVPYAAVSFAFGHLALALPACGCTLLSAVVQSNILHRSSICGLRSAYYLSHALRSASALWLFGCASVGFCATYLVSANVLALLAFAFGACFAALVWRSHGALHGHRMRAARESRPEGLLESPFPPIPGCGAGGGEQGHEPIGRCAETAAVALLAFAVCSVEGAAEFGQAGVRVAFYLLVVALLTTALCTLQFHRARNFGHTAPDAQPAKRTARTFLLKHELRGLFAALLSLVSAGLIMWRELRTADPTLNTTEKGDLSARLIGCAALGVTAPLLSNAAFRAVTGPLQPELAYSLGNFAAGGSLVVFAGLILACAEMAGGIGLAVAAFGYATVCLVLGCYGEILEQAGSHFSEESGALRQAKTSLSAGAKGWSSGAVLLTSIASIHCFTTLSNYSGEGPNLTKPLVLTGLAVGGAYAHVASAILQFLSLTAPFARLPPAFEDFPSHYISMEAFLSVVPLHVGIVIAPPLVGFGFGSEALAGFLFGLSGFAYLQTTQRDYSSVSGNTLPTDGGVISMGLNLVVALACAVSLVLAPLFEPDWTLWYVGVFIIAGVVIVTAMIKCLHLCLPKRVPRASVAEPDVLFDRQDTGLSSPPYGMKGTVDV